MECRVFIDVDCTYVEREDSQDAGRNALKEDILNTLQTGAEPTENITEEDLKAVFCNLLDRYCLLLVLLCGDNMLVC